MTSIRLLAAAVLASSGIALATPSHAGQWSGATVTPRASQGVSTTHGYHDQTLPPSGRTEQYHRRDGKGKGDQQSNSQQNGRRDGTRTRDMDRDWQSRTDRSRTGRVVREWPVDDDRSRARRAGRDWRSDSDRSRGGDWSDRNWRQSDRRDNGNHYGWDRGNHYGWDRGKHYGWDKGSKRKHWRARHHPRHNYYIGRRFPRVHYVIIDHYDDYYLPPPRRGHYYARVDNDVFLVAEATKLIIDAFVLLDATGR